MQEEYKCEQVPAIINIPDNTVKLTVRAKIIEEDDTLQEVEMTMNTAEVMDARISGDEWEQENVMYRLTDYAKELLEKDK